MAERSWSWMSLSLATFVATPVMPRLPISSRVDVTGGVEGAAEVLAQLLVLDRPLHVGA